MRRHRPAKTRCAQDGRYLPRLSKRIPPLIAGLHNPKWCTLPSDHFRGRVMKRLVFCFDGTWNRIDAAHSTNVVMTAESVLPLASDNVSQLIYYHEGVGTGRWDRIRGGIFGSGLVQNLADAYRFLIFNHTPGDEIYVFGFSRGAYTARSFVGLIGCCGILLRKDAGKV